jgi:hypothetical protein
MFIPGLYEHYSGKRYQVLGVCRHSKTLEVLVVYQALYDDYTLWVRPLDMFNETIDHNGQSVPRFKFISKTWTQPAALLD